MRRLLAYEVLIDIDHLHGLARDLLHLLGRGADLGTVLLVGRRDPLCQEMAQGVDHCTHLFASFHLAPS
jgi:hypothetical protein